MKREDILAMEPGRELDALVAELLFGWRRITGPKTDYDGPCEYGDVLISPTVTEEEAFRMMPFKGAIPFHLFVNRNWSTDISAAFEVVEKMKERNWNFILSDDLFKDTWTASFFWDPNQTMIDARQDTAPEAICKAALLAVMNV